MTNNLFKKAIVFTDIHWGLKNNSVVHNNDCDQFINWVIETAKKEGCETGLFLGDWHNHRASINIQTLQYSLRALEKLSKAFDQFFFIPGNHDLYYREKRDIHSIEWASHLPNIHICNDWFQSGDVVIAPWLVGDDYKKITKMSAAYMFGHFELPHFKMNAMVEMPDHGQTKIEHFDGYGSVFSGHFHMRQEQKNIHYIGNCFPHNFADAGDSNRGCMILDWGKKPEYRAWLNQPLYLVTKLSTLIDQSKNLLKENMHVRVELDIDISYEEATFIKNTFINQFNVREMALIPIKTNQVSTDMAPGNIKFESVDQIVIDQISNIESEFYDSKLLLKIYQTL